MASNDYSCPHKSAECTGWVRTKTSDYMTRTCKSCGEKLKKLLPRDELAAKYTPEKVRMISAAGGKKKGTIKFWRVYKNITGYQIALTNRKTGKTVYRTAKTSTKNKRVLTLKNLTQNAKYSVKVRAYHKARGYTFYGKWSKTKTFKTK